jgi:ribosomal protein L11
MRASQGRLTSEGISTSPESIAIIDIARTMRDAKKTLSASLAGGVKEILGTAQSVGVMYRKSSVADRKE